LEQEENSQEDSEIVASQENQAMNIIVSKQCFTQF
jgi:hypothetical protein